MKPVCFVVESKDLTKKTDAFRPGSWRHVFVVGEGFFFLSVMKNYIAYPEIVQCFFNDFQGCFLSKKYTLEDKRLEPKVMEVDGR